MSSKSLKGRMLVALPEVLGLERSIFSHSLIYVCSHDETGAMGLILNKPDEALRLSVLMKKLSLKLSPNVRDVQIHNGGPVDRKRGFVLHSTDYTSPASKTVDENAGIAMTSTIDVLETIAKGDGPENCLMTIGCAKWVRGQLEHEVGRNAWLDCEADADIIFNTSDDEKWEAAVKRLGVDTLLFAPAWGHA